MQLATTSKWTTRMSPLCWKKLGYDLSGKAVNEVDIGSPEDLIR
jgi:hypothetical protein